MDYDKIRGILEQIYGNAAAFTVLESLKTKLDGYRSHLSPRSGGLSERDNLLITYPDQVREAGASPLRSLAGFCNAHLSGIVSGIHILPFYPWTSDDGFSVVDYKQVSREYGDWEDVQLLGGTFKLMFDAVINHVSIENPWFRGMLDGESQYQEYFICPPNEADLSGVVRPRALPLLTTFRHAGEERRVWTTFSADQVDLNYANPAVLLEVVDVLLFYVLRGAGFIRLDAIGYLWKEPGTTCINLPNTHAIIQLFRAILDDLAPWVSLITETNVPHQDNISYFGDGTNEAHMVYNFSLPPLVLHAFQSGSAQFLSNWAAGLSLPSDQVTFFNFLASHDGIGLNPLRGILPEEEIDQVVQRVKAHGGLVSYKLDLNGEQRPYELNINYFDALNDPNGNHPPGVQVDRFVTAHAILLALQGVPGIYFHSLFGSRGWLQGVKETGRNRTINRQKFDKTEIEAKLEDPGSREAIVFRRLARLLELRSRNYAFHPHGRQQVLKTAPEIFALMRTSPDDAERILCLQNVSAEVQPFNLDETDPPGGRKRTWRDIITGHPVLIDGRLTLHPYQTLWLI